MSPELEVYLEFEKELVESDEKIRSKMDSAWLHLSAEDRAWLNRRKTAPDSGLFDAGYSEGYRNGRGDGFKIAIRAVVILVLAAALGLVILLVGMS